ncbi:MAG TPA: SIMPL domain-containing protein [Novosphingobium sp.]|nr:SIMPL domain-containing protein [Novosphingobium sp.]
MRRFVLAAAAVLAAAPAAAAEVQLQVQGPVVEITASETVQSEPDQASVGAGVTTRAPTAVQAMRDNAAQMERVLARLGTLGIPRRDVQTSGISLNPQYRYNNDQSPPTFLGYDATNQVSVILRDVAKVGPTLDALVAAGANNVNGPFFSRDDDKSQRAAAREAAFKAAGEQAQSYARMAGYSGLRLLSVEETLQRGGPIPFDVANNLPIRVTAAKVTPIEPGRVGTSVQLTAKYEMTR